MQDDPNTEPRPQPEGEPLIEEKRNASHAILQTAETIGTGGALTLGGLAVKDLYGQAKEKLGSKGNDSNSKD